MTELDASLIARLKLASYDSERIMRSIQFNRRNFFGTVDGARFNKRNSQVARDRELGRFSCTLDNARTRFLSGSSGGAV